MYLRFCEHMSTYNTHTHTHTHIYIYIYIYIYKICLYIYIYIYTFHKNFILICILWYLLRCIPELRHKSIMIVSYTSIIRVSISCCFSWQLSLFPHQPCSFVRFILRIPFTNISEINFTWKLHSQHIVSSWQYKLAWWI